MAPANTGSDSNKRNAVIKTDHTYKLILCINLPTERLLNTVTIKLIAPIIDDAPDKCKLKIAKSTAGPEWAWILLKGGYTVQPVPAPPSIIAEVSKRSNDGGNNQKLILFIRGKAISGAPMKIGRSLFPNPPIRMGLTIKKIIKNACAVTTTLYNW